MPFQKKHQEMSSVQIHTTNYRNSKQQDHHRSTSLSNGRKHEANTGMYRVTKFNFWKVLFYRFRRCKIHHSYSWNDHQNMISYFKERHKSKIYKRSNATHFVWQLGITRTNSESAGHDTR